MEYIFLVVAAAWSLQFLLSYWQLQRFHRQIAELRKLGRVAVGMYGNRWRGRTYGVLVIDAQELVRHAAIFRGWTVFSQPQRIVGLDGMPLDGLLASDVPVAGLRRTEWLALQHAAQFFNQSPAKRSTPRSTRLDQHA